MSENDVAAEALLEFLNAVEAGVAVAKRMIAEAKGVAEWDPTKIAWQQAEGTKGPYERYPASGQKAEATDDYKNMLAAIKQHGGKMMRGNYFYWLFTDAATVGRKKRSK